MSRANISIAVVAVLLIGVSVWSALRVRAHKDGQGVESQSIVDPLSVKYEYWTIQLSGTHKHKICKGKFKDEYKLDILFPGSLSKIIAQKPGVEPVRIVGAAIYSGQEEVIVAAKSSRSLLIPSNIDDARATVTVSWYAINGRFMLDADIDANVALINGFCAVKNSHISIPVKNLKLITNDFANDTIAGTWTIGRADNGSPSFSEASGVFNMKWVSGGGSSLAIPGPQKLRVTPKQDGSLLLQWAAFPLAKKYDIYYAKGSSFTSSSQILHASNNLAFAAIALEEDGPYSFAVSATIDGIETVRSMINYTKLTDSGE
ncbi:MAG: hypothetical protein ACXVA9_11410 [Bdellovibrionales bacterium]